MKSIAYSSYESLECGPCGGSIVLCVDPAVTLTGSSLLEATLVSLNYDVDNCGNTKNIYGITYDESQLLDPNVDLTEANITGIICRGCLTNYIDVTSSGTFKDWTPTVIAYPTPVFGSLDSYTPHCRYITTPSNNHVTIMGTIDLTITGTIGGIRFTLPTPIHAHEAGGGCILLLPLTIPPQPSNIGTIRLHTEGGGFYADVHDGDNATSLSSSNVGVIFSISYEET